MVFFLDEFYCLRNSELGKKTTGKEINEFVFWMSSVWMRKKERAGEEDNWEEINDFFFWMNFYMDEEKRASWGKKTTGR